MKAIITIQMDNAAFESPNSAELSYILHKLSNEIYGDDYKTGDKKSLRDSNGNTVGQMVIKK